MSETVKKGSVLTGLAISVALILWLTLFSRLGNETRHFYSPFWSYRAIANGSGKALIEVIGNIILFLPIGLIAGLLLHLNLWQTLIFGFSFSLLIESCQWFFWLGSFEIDDLLHNMLGAVIGFVCAKQIKPFDGDRKKNALILVSLIALMIVVGFGYQGLKNQTMVRYAAMNDRADGTKNLLILNPDPKYIGTTGFSVSYNDDGSVLIEGSSENKAWIAIGSLTLPEGTYTFSGLSGMDEKTIAIELEYLDKNSNNYVRLTPEVGIIDEVVFVLDKETRVRALIRLYAGAEGAFLTRPVIYREED